MRGAVHSNASGRSTDPFLITSKTAAIFWMQFNSSVSDVGPEIFTIFI